MVTACENLVTKQEFNELKQQLNALLGKVETGTPVNVLAQGNFDGTLIGDQLEFATNSVQNIEFQDTNGASVTTFDDNTLEKLAAGALTIVALKGKDLYVPLKILTKSVVSRAGKIFTNIGIGKLAMAGGALSAMSASTMVSLLLIITSLAQSIANLQVLAARIDATESGLLTIDRSIRDNFEVTAKNYAQIQKNEKIAKENDKKIATNQETLKQIEQIQLDIEADVEKNNQAISDATQMIDNFKAEFEQYKIDIENYKGETTEEINKLKTNVATLEENLKITDEKLDEVLVITEKISIELANTQGKMTELQVEFDKLKIQSSINIADMIQLKKDLSDHKIISKSKINSLRARLVLLEDNMSNLEEIDGGFPFLPFPVQEQIADTQNKTLVLANSLTSNPADTDDLVITPGTVLTDNNFAKTFDQILEGINIGDLGAADVNIPELAVAISNLVIPDISTNINTNIDTKLDGLGLPDLSKDIGEIKTNTSSINLEKAAGKAICNSTKGAGCMIQNIGNPIQNTAKQAAKETAKSIAEILEKLKELLDQETLERVKDIQKKINQEGENAALDKTIMAATYLNSLHNAALLSTNVDETMNWIAADAYKALKLKNYQGEDIEPQNWTKARLNEADQLAETTNKSKIEEENRLNKIAPVIPESWQVKVGSDRPQLIVVYKPKSKKYPTQTSRWSLTIPHPNPEINPQDFVKLMPEYKKGNTYGMLILVDNSRLTVNAKDESEAKEMIEKVLANNLINPDFISKKKFIKTGNMGTDYKELEVIPEAAKFFSKGQQDNNPDWIAFSND